MAPTAPSRAAALDLLGWCDDVPDGPLSDAVAEACPGLDALTLREGWAVDRAYAEARRLLVRLAAHDGRTRCLTCGGVMAAGWPEAARCACPGPTPAGLLAALAEALREAGDPRADVVAADQPGAAVYQLTTLAGCPRCGGGVAAVRPPALWACCDGVGCGWSGPASTLLPPLMTRAELDAEIEALRRGGVEPGGKDDA